ncbi:MAG: transcriptional regulator [Planctomycetaceae bacterium]|jgi:nitrogen regulatory protein P-II 1|nr:transcriptional regulator [Planctomycetaceae bacterium]|tara:strand:+ start:2298 stop:2645 length:348 start_codon:yes stop_codon:yes gene_type:complete
MKLVVAIIQPTKLKAVQSALEKAGVTRMTACDSLGFARQRGQSPLYRGMEYKSQLLRKVSLEIAVNDDFVEKTIDVICAAAKTGPDGNIGDGKIFVLPMAETVDLSGNIRGPEAV